MLLKRSGDNKVPTGNTVILEEDCLVLSARTPETISGIELREIVVHEDDRDYVGKSLSEIAATDQGLVVMIQRDGDVIIPKGDVVLRPGDILVINEI